ncbi:unnamed protein product, partial [Iphiclides podalirius]
MGEPRPGGTAFLITVSPTPVNGHKGGDGAYAVPTTKNNASELSTLGIIAGVNPTAVQWESLALGEPPS